VLILGSGAVCSITALIAICEGRASRWPSSDPTYVVDDVVHYCVTNMPGAAERTLSNVKAPFVLTIADKGYAPALMADPCVTGAISMTGM
jgi:alanine dehydrogenase